MSEHVWEPVRDELISRWADTPHAALEQRILDVWMNHPQLVLDAVDNISAQFTQGSIRSPWGVLAKRVEQAALAAERSKTAVSGERDKAKAVQQAEQWVRTAGVYFDRESEVEDELFGDFGKLRSYADDAELRDHMLALWAAQRPRGERAEAEAEERARRYRDAQSAAARPAAVQNGREDDDAAPHSDALAPAAATANPFIDDE